MNQLFQLIHGLVVCGIEWEWEGEEEEEEKVENDSDLDPDYKDNYDHGDD